MTPLPNTKQPEMSDLKVLVVGTTDDYIEKIRQDFPGQALFLTESSERDKSQYPSPEPPEEITAGLEQPGKVVEQLWLHLRKWDQRLCGITAFDCESLQLAARIAQIWKIPYPSPMAVELCRDKLRSKEAWRQAGVPCPKAVRLDMPGDVYWLWEWMESPVILKPRNGTGGELVFRCQGAQECKEKLQLISDGLNQRSYHRLYHNVKSITGGTGAGIVMEECIEGDEFSCDFVIRNNTATIIRIARKYKAPGQPFGTIRAYLVPAGLPQGLSKDRLEEILKKAAEALGLEQAICMVDFIVRGKTPYLLEMAPRPGGDCLPDLIRMASGLDMLGLSLDLAKGKPLDKVPGAAWRTMVGLRMFSSTAGQIVDLDANSLKRDPRVLQVELKHRAGDMITLPPLDYDSRLLGHVIFEPDSLENLEQECQELESMLSLGLEQTG